MPCAAQTSLPIMLYNNPQYAGCVEFTAREVARLAEEGVIQSVKSTFESVVPVQDLLYLCGDKLRVFYGSFNAPMEAFMAGAHGWVSGFLNMFTREAVEMYNACFGGRCGARARDLAVAAALQAPLQPPTSRATQRHRHLSRRAGDAGGVWRLFACPL